MAGEGSVTASGVDRASGVREEAAREAATSQTPMPTAKTAALPASGTIEVTIADGRVIKLDGEVEEVSDHIETITRRVKEQDKVIVLKFPAVTNIKQWHNQLARNLVLASGRTDAREVAWIINEVVRPGSRLEGFASSGDARFLTLDTKLHMAATAVIKEGNRALSTIGVADSRLVQIEPRHEAALRPS